MKIKKAQTTIPLFTMILVFFVMVIVLGTFLFFFGTINAAFQGSIPAGQVNLTNASDTTFGQINDAFLNTADLIGVFFLFGLMLAIMFAGFMTRDQTPKLMFMVDFIIIIFAYILATYMSNAYETILTELPFSNLIASNLNTTSRLLLFLPVLTIVTGFVTMLLTYAGIPRRGEEQGVGGFS